MDPASTTTLTGLSSLRNRQVGGGSTSAPASASGSAWAEGASPSKARARGRAARRNIGPWTLGGVGLFAREEAMTLGNDGEIMTGQLHAVGG